MKKKILFLLTIFILAAALVACSPGMEALNKKNEEVSAWKGSEISGTIDYKIKMSIPEPVEEGSNETIETKTLEMSFPVEVTGVAEGQEKVKMTVSLDTKNLKNALAAQGETEGLDEMPDKVQMELYVSKEGDIYISTGYFQSFGALKDIDEKYIKLSSMGTSDAITENNPMMINPMMNVELVKYLQSPEYIADLEELAKVAFKGYEGKEFVKVDGNKFNIKFTSDELLDESGKALDAVKANWTEVAPKLSEFVKKFGAPEEAANELQNAFDNFDKEKFTNSIDMMKTMLSGSFMEENIEFKDDEYISDVNMQLNFGAMFNANINGKFLSKKNESAEVEYPEDVKSLTYDEFMELLNPQYKLQKELQKMGVKKTVVVRLNGEDIFFDGIQAFIYNDRTYVPIRGLFEKLGAEVNWDEATRTVTVKNADSEIKLTVDSDKAFVNGKEIKLDAPMMNVADRTVAPLRFVSENIAYKVKYVPFGEFLSYIDVYNISDEELNEKLEEFNASVKEMQKMMEEKMGIPKEK